VKINNFFTELKRRNVYKAAIAAMERTASRVLPSFRLIKKNES